MGPVETTVAPGKQDEIFSDLVSRYVLRSAGCWVRGVEAGGSTTQVSFSPPDVPILLSATNPAAGCIFYLRKFCLFGFLSGAFCKSLPNKAFPYYVHNEQSFQILCLTIWLFEPSSADSDPYFGSLLGCHNLVFLLNK